MTVSFGRPAKAILNARLPGCSGLQKLWVESQGTIQKIEPMAAAESTEETSMLLDLEGDWLSPGGVDLQINGALGLAFPDLKLQHLPELQAIGELLFAQGVDAFLPTLVTTSVDKIQQSLATISAFIDLDDDTAQSTTDKVTGRTIKPAAQILGVHLEGPCLNREKRGAHPEEHLLPLTLEQMKQVLGKYGEIVKLVTLAPELDPTGTVIPYLRSQNIVVSLGHSQATAQQAQQAFDLGASMVTHAFNAMPGIHHREPGLLGAAVLHPGVCCGLIADGQHVCPSAIALLLRASQCDRAVSAQPAGVFLVSDALAPLGLPDGRYPWDRRQIEVNQGTARLSDGTLAGTTLPLLAGVQNLVRWGICAPEVAIAMATEVPRMAMGLTELPSSQQSEANGCDWFYRGQLARNLLHWQTQGNSLTWQRLQI